MDADHFDNLLRSLARMPSRRSALRLLAGSALGGALAPLFGLADARAKRKRKKKKKRKNASLPGPGVACTPNCDRKICGDDGCGGSCGSCAGNETCQDGKCVCVPDCAGKSCGDDGCGGLCGSCVGNEACQGGTCVCAPNCTGKSCGSNGCGGFCGTCSGGRDCIGGACVCPSGTESCGGTCQPLCPAGRVRVPGTCECCTVNGRDCSSDTFTECCSRSCPVGVDVCQGRPNGAMCTFDAQCQSDECEPGGFCGGQIGG